MKGSKEQVSNIKLYLGVIVRKLNTFAFAYFHLKLNYYGCKKKMSRSCVSQQSNKLFGANFITFILQKAQNKKKIQRIRKNVEY